MTEQTAIPATSQDEDRVEAAASQAGVPYPMIRAILASKDCAIGVVPEWNPVNDQQRAFLDNHFNPTRVEADSIEEIESIASPDADVVNSFLSERGFDIKLEPLSDDECGMAAVLDYPWKWLDEGEEAPITIRDGDRIAAAYPGAVVSDGVSFYRAGEQVLVRIETQTDDVIWMAMESNPAKDYDLVIQAQRLQQQATPADDITTKNWNDEDVPVVGVHFPCVDLNLQTTVDWLIEMYGNNEDGRRVRITQALQQTKLRMNEAGGRCESAAAVAMAFECMAAGPPPSYVIDKPFLLWLDRPSLSQPLFALHLCEDVWNKPENLD